LTLGSSGAAHLLPILVDALAGQPVTVIASTAGVPVPRQLPGNVFIADYLPGMEAAGRANLVICNGGSPTSQQALAAGVPVLGIAGNMDQFLNMAAIVDAGAGTILRADRLSRNAVRQAVSELLTQTGAGARALAGEFAKFDAPRRFAELVGQILSGASAKT
jgi:UDP:flavonoid glycosyltransferase YjiC (YdhE family)